jgi:hypothetical protein
LAAFRVRDTTAGIGDLQGTRHKSKRKIFSGHIIKNNFGSKTYWKLNLKNVELIAQN